MTSIITATVDPGRNHVEAHTVSGRTIAMDAEADTPEANPGPKETVLAALAGCTAMDVGAILRKKRQVAESYQVHVTAESADEHPKRFVTISVEHRVGGDVNAEALRRAIELSATRYCPVSAMLSASCQIEHSYRLTSADGSQASAVVAITGPDGSRVQ